jgi:hypothetical protein
MKNRVRHNHIDIRRVHIDDAIDDNYMSPREHNNRYRDLWYDYEKQQRDVYIKPKRAIQAWNKNEERIAHSSKPRVIREANKEIIRQLRHDKLQRELGM